jgi:tetratricopeptide (TPR) repeat protein
VQGDSSSFPGHASAPDISNGRISARTFFLNITFPDGWAARSPWKEDADTLNNLGFSFYQNGNYRAAVDRLKRAAKLAPNDERILNNLGLAYCRLGKVEEAYKAFARATGPVNGNLNTAKMLERFGREDDAIRYYEAARQLDSNNTIALRRLVDLYQRGGRANESQSARNALILAQHSGNVGATGH